MKCVYTCDCNVDGLAVQLGLQYFFELEQEEKRRRADVALQALLQSYLYYSGHWSGMYRDPPLFK